MDNNIESGIVNNEIVLSNSNDSTKEAVDNTPSFREAVEKGLKEDSVDNSQAPKVPEQRESAQRAPKAPVQPEAQQFKPDNTPPPVLPPADMKPEETEAFKKADPKLQAYLSRRAYENRVEVSRANQKASDLEKKYEHIEREVAPNREWLVKHGYDESKLLARAISWEKFFKEDPTEAAKQYLAAQGVDPFELIDDNSGQVAQPQGQQSQELLTPQQVEELIEQRLQKENQLNQQAHTTSQNMNLVQKFIETKPLFRDPATASQLEAEMAPLVAHYSRSMPPDKALEKAYDVVTKGNETYSALLASFSQRQQADKARVDAEKARQSSRFVSGGMSGSSRSSEGLSFREEARLRLNGSM